WAGAGGDVPGAAGDRRGDWGGRDGGAGEGPHPRRSDLRIGAAAELAERGAVELGPALGHIETAVAREAAEQHRLEAKALGRAAGIAGTDVLQGGRLQPAPGRSRGKRE